MLQKSYSSGARCSASSALLSCANPTARSAPIADPAGIAAAMTAITNAVVEGAITPGEAAEVAKIVDTLVRAIEASDFDRWLKLLEAEA
jgi:hypothetical protein